MPMTQKSIASPAALRGTPKRASWSARARRQRQLERGLGQLGHRPGDVGQRRALLDVEHGEPLQGQLAGDAHRAAEVAALALQLLDQGDDAVAAGQAGRQRRELGRIAAADALDEAAVLGAVGAGRRRRRMAGRRGRHGSARARAVAMSKEPIVAGGLC